MGAADYAEFEKTVPIFGEQRAIRRKQLQVIGASAVPFSLLGGILAKSRGNTTYVYGLALIPCAVGGMAVGHVLGQRLFPSMASNKETRFVRRLWWANKCAQTW